MEGFQMEMKTMKFELKLSGKSLAAAVVLFLAVVLALAATIAGGSGARPFNAPALSETIAQEENSVTPRELARWLVEKRQDLQLIDTRASWQFDDYHIPSAINLPLSQLFGSASLGQLSRGKKVVLYGTNSGRAAQAQLLLSMKGYNTFFLHDGISGWWLDVMTPASLRSEEASPAGYIQAKQLRDYFAGAAPPSTTRAQPAPAVPAPPPSSETPQKKGPEKLKLGRGCS